MRKFAGFKNMTNLKLSYLIPVLAVLCSAPGCRETVQTARPTVPVVERMLLSQSRETRLLQSFDPADPKGAVSVIGPSERAVRLTGLLLSSDEFDNVDGRLDPDQLPDFAGETVQLVSDDAHTPYHRFIEQSDSDSLRAVTVRHLINAVDNHCSIGAFDDGLGYSKTASKLVVFASPYPAQYGAFDVDTLCRSLSADIPVVFPVKSVLSGLLDSSEERLHVAVLTDSLTALDGVHGHIFAELCRERGILGSDCVAFARDTVGDALVNMLEEYRQSGGMIPLSVIVTDDGIPADDLKVSLENIRTLQTETNLHLRRLITPDCRIIDTDLAAAEECYRILRRRNIFTHNISFPQAEAYVTVPASSGKGFRLVETDKYVQD